MAVSKGVWFDTKAKKVVESQPEEGVVLVAAGTEATDADTARVEAFRSGGPSEPKTVTSKSSK